MNTPSNRWGSFYAGFGKRAIAPKMKRNVKKYEGRRKNGSEMPQNNCGRLLKFTQKLWGCSKAACSIFEAQRDRPVEIMNLKIKALFLSSP